MIVSLPSGLKALSKVQRCVAQRSGESMHRLRLFSHSDCLPGEAPKKNEAMPSLHYSARSV